MLYEKVWVGTMNKTEMFINNIFPTTQGKMKGNYKKKYSFKIII